MPSKPEPNPSTDADGHEAFKPAKLADRLFEPGLVMAAVSVLVYFVGLRYWRCYLAALDVEATWLDPSVTRLLGFGFNGVVFAAAALGLIELASFLRPWRRRIVFLVAMGIVMLLFGFPPTGVAITEASVEGAVGCVSIAVLLFAGEMTWLERLTPSSTKRLEKRAEWLGEHVDDLVRRIGAIRASRDEPSSGELSALEHDVADARAEQSALRRERARVLLWLRGAGAALLIVTYTYTAMPMLARFDAYNDVARASWYSMASADTPLVTDGSTVVAVRKDGDACTVVVTFPDKTQFFKKCPRVRRRDASDALSVEMMDERLRALERETRFARLAALSANIEMALSKLREARRAAEQRDADADADPSGPAQDAGAASPASSP